MFASTPHWGHLNPMLPLAGAFRERGDDVLWATPAGGCARLARHGFAARPTGADAGDKPIPTLLERFPEIASLPPREQPDRLFAKVFGLERAEPMLDDLLEVVDDWSPSLIVRDAAELASPVAGALRGVPCVTHSFGPLLPGPRVAAGGDEVAPLWEKHGLAPRPYGGSYDHLYIDIYPASMQDQHRPHIPATQHLRTVTAPVPSRDAGSDVLSRAGSLPIVYMTMGTVFNTLEPLRELLAAVRELGVFAVLTVGPDGDIGALGDLPDNAHVAHFIPQSEVLPHCSAVVSHAGSGTVLGSLAIGLPQVLVPLGADQFLNADACARAGAGVSVAPKAAEVRDGLERVLEQDAFRAGAARVRDEIAAMPSPADVAARLADAYG